MSVALFVYGTLAPGEPSWPRLRPFVLDSREVAVPGRLYDTGRGYPGAVFEAGSSVVHGWCCTLADPPIAELDAFEGDEYDRVTVCCTDGTEALAYHWTASLDGCTHIPTGTWSGVRD